MSIGNLCHSSEQFDEDTPFEAVVGLGQDAIESAVCFLDRPHCIVDSSRDVFALWEI